MIAKRRPEDFLELVQKGKRGRLKLYIGFAVGVGKTYRMLEEGHALRKRGVDVVVGFVETHGRADTEVLREGLEERMGAVEIYARQKGAGAIENFFKGQNLVTLRELALREVAESLDRAMAAQERPGDPPRRGGRVMVCMSSNPPRAATLLRRGSRMAGRLNTDWFVVYVETPEEAPDRIDSEAQRHLLGNVEKARELGAEVVRLKSADPVSALLDFARSHGVGHIIVGRSHAPLWQRVLGRSVLQRLVDESEGLDLHIVSFEEEDTRA